MAVVGLAASGVIARWRPRAATPLRGAHACPGGAQLCRSAAVTVALEQVAGGLDFPTSLGFDDGGALWGGRVRACRSAVRVPGAGCAAGPPWSPPGCARQ
jgi:hypothetical protein